ncbi:Cthe_2314 family HEPN domain-containing protein [Peribacillus frigoritolerans]|uniref:Cthe_2314 family HEPN domain-containing protein n=1 Tax=Peribacillus frigoritolerans TaxID=450367 RepID=UPI003D02740D
MQKEEYKYLNSLIQEVKEIVPFNVGIFIMGNSNSDSLTKELIYLNDIDGWLRNLNYIIEQINKSGEMVLEILNKQEERTHSFWGIEDREAYYYIENIMFRLTILWDILAQLANDVFEVKEPIDGIHYKTFFIRHSKQSKSNEEIYIIAEEIKNYLDENEGDNTENPWKGNHKYVNNLRNSFTHRLNPHLVNFHNGIFNRKENEKSGITLPTSPLYELKRILEDYVQVYKFVLKIKNDYVKEVKLVE